MNPRNENALDQQGKFNETQQKQHSDFSPDQKRLATLCARAAMAGVQLHVTVEKEKTIYIVSRWYMSRTLDSLDEAEKWLDYVTGVQS